MPMSFTCLTAPITTKTSASIKAIRSSTSQSLPTKVTRTRSLKSFKLKKFRSLIAFSQWFLMKILKAKTFKQYRLQIHILNQSFKKSRLLQPQKWERFHTKERDSTKGMRVDTEGKISHTDKTTKKIHSLRRNTQSQINQKSTTLLSFSKQAILLNLTIFMIKKGSLHSKSSIVDQNSGHTLLVLPEYLENLRKISLKAFVKKLLPKIPHSQ